MTRTVAAIIGVSLMAVGWWFLSWGLGFWSEGE